MNKRFISGVGAGVVALSWLLWQTSSARPAECNSVVTAHSPKSFQVEPSETGRGFPNSHNNQSGFRDPERKWVGKLTLRVISAVDSAPIGDALVATDHEEARTDAEGIASLTGSDAGILVRADGFAPARKLIGNDESVHTVRLEPGFGVMGRTVDTAGHPLSGVTVSLSCGGCKLLNGSGGKQLEHFRVTADSRTIYDQQTTSDSDGKFEFKCARPLRQLLYASKPGYCLFDDSSRGTDGTVEVSDGHSENTLVLCRTWLARIIVRNTSSLPEETVRQIVRSSFEYPKGLRVISHSMFFVQDGLLKSAISAFEQREKEKSDIQLAAVATDDGTIDNASTTLSASCTLNIVGGDSVSVATEWRWIGEALPSKVASWDFRYAGETGELELQSSVRAMLVRVADGKSVGPQLALDEGERAHTFVLPVGEYVIMPVSNFLVDGRFDFKTIVKPQAKTGFVVPSNTIASKMRITVRDESGVGTDDYWLSIRHGELMGATPRQKPGQPVELSCDPGEYRVSLYDLHARVVDEKVAFARAGETCDVLLGWHQ